jgi:uncharacterized membrane protein
MPPLLRKAVLATHIGTSVGWLGALLAYLTLDITVATGANIETVRGAAIAMDLLVRYAIVPLAIASVFIGIINALGTPWGLFRHYWVLAKLILTLFAAGVLFLQVASLRYLADLATAPEPHQLRGTLLHSVGGTVVLVTTLILSVFKPRGLTHYGWRQHRRSRASTAAPKPST